MNDGAQKNASVLVLAGIAPGFGTSIAKTFSEVGYRVAGVSRSQDPGSAVHAELASSGRAYRHYACDVTQPTQVDEMLKAVTSELGAPAVLVYNPMQLLIKPFLDLTVEDFEAVWRVTCLGAVIMARAMLPTLLRAGTGTIIFSGATASTRGSAQFASLAVAKFGLRGLAQSLAREFGPQGVHVVHTVLDGLIWAPQTRARFNPVQDDCIAPEAIAKTYLQLVGQHRSAWTQEIDLRPAQGKF
ncbi:MAG: SDR family NAD(P)-dependent oxidoreductase [Panacagrimonas sp.]